MYNFVEWNHQYETFLSLFDASHLWFSDNKVMLIMSIGELANLLKQKSEVEQKTNKLLILIVGLYLIVLLCGLGGRN